MCVQTLFIIVVSGNSSKTPVEGQAAKLADGNKLIDRMEKWEACWKLRWTHIRHNFCTIRSQQSEILEARLNISPGTFF